MIRSRIIFKDEAANGTDMVSSTLTVEDIECLLRVAKRNEDDFLTVPTSGQALSIVPLSNIALVRDV